MRDTLVSNSGIAQGMPSKVQVLPNSCCALLPSLQIDRDTLIEQSNILLKQLLNIIYCDISIDTIE